MGMMNQPTALEHVLITTKVEKIINWSRATSVWPMTFGLACCAIEMMAAGAARFDFDRFGCGIFRATPRQSDLMIVAGTVTYKMAPIIRQLYDQMPEPKWVIALGSCATAGGPFDSYHTIQGGGQGGSRGHLHPGLPAPSREPDLRLPQAPGQDHDEQHGGPVQGNL